MSVDISHLPFDQLYNNEIAAISRVVEQQPIRGCGLKLKEKVHGGVGLQGPQGQVAGPAPESDGVGNDVAHAEASVELTVRDVAIFAQIQVGHPVDCHTLQVPDKVGWNN